MISLKVSISLRAVLIAIALVLVTVILIGFILYNKPHRSVENEKAIEVTASQLFKAFEENEEKANEMYLNKTVLVTGSVSEVSSNQEGKPILILGTDNPMFGVSCTLENQAAGVLTGTSVTVKGICTGYLSDVVITRGIISKNEK